MNVKKTYEEAILTIIEFAEEDVITTSSGEIYEGERFTIE